MNIRSLLAAGGAGALLLVPALHALADPPEVLMPAYCPAPGNPPGSPTNQANSTAAPNAQPGDAADQRSALPDGGLTWVQLSSNASGNVGASGPHGHVQAEGGAPSRNGSVNGYSTETGANGFIGTDDRGDKTGDECVGVAGTAVDVHSPALPF